MVQQGDERAGREGQRGVGGDADVSRRRQAREPDTRVAAVHDLLQDLQSLRERRPIVAEAPLPVRVHLGADRLPALAQRLRIGVVHRRQDAEDGRVGPRQRLVAPRRERCGVGMVLLDPGEIRPPVVATRRQQQATRQPAPAVLRHRATRQPRQLAESTAAHQCRRFPHQRRAGGAGRRQLDAAAVGVGQGDTHADRRGSELDRGGCQHLAVRRPLHDLDAPGGDVGQLPASRPPRSGLAWSARAMRRAAVPRCRTRRRRRCAAAAVCASARLEVSGAG